MLIMISVNESLIVGLMLAGVSVSHAQEANNAAPIKTLGALKAVDDEDTAVTARRSSAATKTDTPLRDVPQTINVVSSELLRDQGALSMEAALRNVPGVAFSHGDGQRDQVVIRGFTAISDQFVDGRRNDELYFRDLSGIERIEVLKGPATVLYGRGSSGGLINRVSKKAQLGETFGDAAITPGSFEQKRIEGDVNLPLGSAFAFRVNGAVEDADSYRD